MIILHGGELDGSLAVWAETSDPKKPKSKKQPATPSRYPFGVDAATLVSILKSLGLKNAQDVMRTVNVWLPTRSNGSPVPSSGMIDGYASRPANARRVPWLMNAAEIPAGDATMILGQMIGDRMITGSDGSGIIIGSDLAYMIEAMRLAGLVVAGQQYLPDVRPSTRAESAAGNWYEVSWSPVISAEYSEHFESLSGRMPGSVRAITRTAARNSKAGHDMTYRDNGPKNPPAQVLQRFVSRIADHLIRMAVAQDQARRPSRKFDSIHDAWIYHLRSSEPGEIRGHDVPLFYEQVEEWKQPVTSASRSPLRLCFRLEEPKSQDGPWLIRYLLQPRGDPSLLVPADAAWKAKSSEVALPRGTNAKEFLLTSLGQAAGIVPSLTEGLDGGNSNSEHGMTGRTTDAQGAHTFLTKEAAALRQAGYGVIFPAWWTGRGTKIRAKSEIKAPRSKGTGMFDFASVVSFDWKIAIGDQEMTIEELRKLAKAKAPLVMMRGEWTEVSPEDIKRAIRFLQAGTGKKRSLMDVLKMRIGVAGPDGTAAGRNSGEIEVEVTSKDSRILQILDQLNDKTKMKDKRQPAGFTGKLRPYQLRGFSWMSFLQRFGLGGCLADDMGLGKTIQVLALVQQYKQAAKDGSRKPFLLICPTSVISNWEKESKRFTPELDIMIHHGSDRDTAPAAFKKNAQKHDIVVSSYGLLHRDLKAIRGAQWGGIVLDEAQNIKNARTKQAQASRAIDADCRFALTGTPVENNVGDLWSIMEFLNPGLLGSEASFQDNFFVPIQMMRDSRAAERLKRATGPFMLRRLKTDKSIITDLPKKVETKTYCQLTKEQATLYGAVIEEIGGILGMGDDEKSAGTKVSAFRRKGIILAALTKLKQVCDHPAVFLKDNSQTSGAAGRNRSGKLMRLTEMLSEVTESGDSALVFTQFVEMGHVIKAHLQESLGREVLFLHGGTPRGQRDAMVARFQEGYDDKKKSKVPREPKIFVISLRAGGTGLNLTAASHVFHFDRWWNPAVEDQATDRAFRIGQKRNVQVHKMICSGTLEERIDDTIEMKKEISSKVVGTGEGWLTEMSNEDLKDILALSAGATMASSEDGGG